MKQDESKDQLQDKKTPKVDQKTIKDATIQEYVAETDPTLSEGYSPEVGDEYDNAQEAIKASYSDKELAELFGVKFDEKEIDAIKAIVGEDNRDLEDSAKYPLSAICKLYITTKNGGMYHGTGFFISPRVVVTAGHCVYLREAGGWAKSIEVIPRLNKSQKPFGSAFATRFVTYGPWISHGDINYDIGIIILPENNKLGNKTGWWGFMWAGAGYYKGLPITTAGYPGDKDRRRCGEMWRMSGNDTSLFNNDMKIKYSIDTYGGQSGSPVWVSGTLHGRVIGVHTTGYYYGGKGAYNLATRLDEAKFKLLVSYKDRDLKNQL